MAIPIHRSHAAGYGKLYSRIDTMPVPIVLVNQAGVRLASTRSSLDGLFVAEIDAALAVPGKAHVGVALSATLVCETRVTSDSDAE